MKVLFTILLLSVSSIFAQTAQTGATTVTTPKAPGLAGEAKIYTELIASTESIVKGAPFSAEAVNENVQTLGDGNRIVRNSSSKLYRDGEGRFRRDASVSSGGSLVSSVSSTTITDPVGGFRYYVNDKTRTVRKTPFKLSFDFKFSPDFKLSTGTGTATGPAAVINEKIQTEVAAAGYAATIKATSPQAQVELEKTIEAKTIVATTGGSGQMFTVHSDLDSASAAANTESLGTRNFDGVEAEGTRTTTTIAAGAIGNERPIETVYEKWYSKQLKMIVYSRHSDPRFGEQTYRLTNINLGEPDASVFVVPADYKVEEAAKAPKAMMIPASPKVVTSAAPASAPAPAPGKPAAPKEMPAKRDQ